MPSSNELNGLTPNTTMKTKEKPTKKRHPQERKLTDVNIYTPIKACNNYN